MGIDENSRVIQILDLEDSLADRELVREFQLRGGIQCQVSAVSAREEFTDALQVRTWDIILSDHSLPGFEAEDMLPAAIAILLVAWQGAI
jgi:CheY-like chemotaxis protein